MSACYSSGSCRVDVQSRFKMDNIWQYLKCGCVFLVLPLFVCLTGLSEGTHTSNPPSQPEDSTAWDSFQVSGGRIHLLLELWWSSDHLSDTHNFFLKFLFIQHLYLYFSHALSPSAPVLWQHRRRHPSSTQSPPESRPPHPLSAPFVWLHPWELCPGRAGPAGKDFAAAVPASRGPAGQMVFNNITTTYTVLTLSPNC